MKYILRLMIAVSFISLINSCDLASTDPTISGLKGYLYYAEYENYNIRRYNFQTEVSEVLIQNARYPEVTAQGDIIAISPDPFMLFKTNFTNYKTDTILNFHFFDSLYKSDIIYPRISFDQKYIAYVGPDYDFKTKIYIINSSNGSLIASIGDDREDIFYVQPRWSPDGSIFVSSAYGYPSRGIYKISSDFKTVTLIDTSYNYQDVSVSPDGKYLAFISDGNIWTIGVDGKNPKQVHQGTLHFYYPTWSPDSKFIAAISVEEDGFAYVFDLSNNSYMPLRKLGRLDLRNQLTWVY